MKFSLYKLRTKMSSPKESSSKEIHRYNYSWWFQVLTVFFFNKKSTYSGRLSITDKLTWFHRFHSSAFNFQQIVNLKFNITMHFHFLKCYLKGPITTINLLKLMNFFSFTWEVLLICMDKTCLLLTACLIFQAMFTSIL